jgi:hypothetical protein
MTAYENFMNIVNTVGGPNERERAKALSARVSVKSVVFYFCEKF